MTFERKQYHALAAIVLGAVMLVALLKMASHPASQGAPAPTVSTETPASPNGGAGDRVHELKMLQVELEKKPNHAPILLRMAQLSREMGKPAEAAADLRRLLGAEPGNVEARIELGRVLYDTNDVAGAITETNRVLEAHPKNVDAMYNLGAIYANLGKADLARQYWTRAAAADPESDSGRQAKSGLQQLGVAAVTHLVKQ